MTEDQNEMVDRTDQGDRQWPTGTWIAIGIALDKVMRDRRKR